MLNWKSLFKDLRVNFFYYNRSFELHFKIQFKKYGQFYFLKQFGEKV